VSDLLTLIVLWPSRQVLCI